MGATSDPWRYACPECGSRSIRNKSSNDWGGERTHEEDHDCISCGSHFDEPVDLVQEGAADV